MAIVSIADLKAKWIDNYIPNQDDYHDFFDSYIHQSQKDASNGVLPLDQFKKFAASYVSADGGTLGQGIIINADGEFEIGDLASSGIVAILDNATIDEFEATKVGTKYDVGLIQLEDTDTEDDDYKVFNLYQRLKYQDKTDTTFVIDEEDMGTFFGMASLTTSRQATLPEIDNNRWGALYAVANISNRSTYQSVITTSGSDLLPANRIKEIIGNTDLSQFNVDSNRYYIFAMPKTGTTWQVIQQGTWDEALKKQLTASLNGTTISIDAARGHFWDVSSTNGSLTLNISNAEDGDLIQLDLLGGGKITTWTFTGHASKTVKVIGDDGDTGNLWGSGDNLVLIDIGRTQVKINIRELTTKS